MRYRYVLSRRGMSGRSGARATLPAPARVRSGEALRTKHEPDVDVHEEGLPLSSETVRRLQQQARDREGESQACEQHMQDRSRSDKPPQRWLGRPPGYCSRGR